MMTEVEKTMLANEDLSYSRLETTLNPEAKAAWLEALRSEAYPQTNGELGNSDGFCCLGVACEVALSHGVTMELGLSEHGTMFFDSMSQYLPTAVEDWLGVGSMNPMVRLDIEAYEALREWDHQTHFYAHQMVSLSELNDAAVPFRMIADIIDRLM